MLELNEEETDLVQRIEAYLKLRANEEYSLMKQRFECLDALGKAISQYPSVRENHMLRGVMRSEEQLLDALCSFASPSHLLHVPARVVAARSYLVAKYQAFSLLHILAGDQEEFYRPIRNAILSVIHTLMAEEVYFSCLDDAEFPKEIKLNLANDLVALWDSGTDPRAMKHLPVLDALWTVRDSSPPAFGTMNGTSELFRITMDMGKDWNDFVIANMTINETRYALEEFLFGLSFEEIETVRSRLIRLGINAVSHDEIQSFLGRKPSYGIVSNSDYREMYDFYVDRRDAARIRLRFSIPGPGRALEEIYIKYRVIHE